MRRKLTIMLGVAASALALSGLPVADGAVKKSATVRATDYQFTPATVTIKRGGTVTWRFKQGVHNVVGRRWGNKKLRSGGKWSQKFKRKGTYAYSCTIHFGMNGKVVVK